MYFGTYFKDGDNYVLSNKSVNDFSKKKSDAASAICGENLEAENRESITANLQVIASVNGTNSEAIHGFLNKIRENIN